MSDTYFENNPDLPQDAYTVERARMREVADRLEEKFSSLGLKFTEPFEGAVPVQAYGHIDGERFYFRYRSAHASLKVGPFDAEREQTLAEQDVERAERKFAAWQETHPDADEDAIMIKRIWTFTSLYTPQKESDKDFYPSVITREAHVSGPRPDEKFDGWLTPGEAEDVFSRLVESLAPVDAEQ